MIRTTYRGREIKVLAARGKPHHRKMVINGHTVNHAWQGDDTQGLNWFKLVIDRMDAAGGPGHSAAQPPYERHWWEPGTFDVNPNGHVTQRGGLCACCTAGDGTPKFAPLAPDACQHCHQPEDSHDDDVYLEWHCYVEPTPHQRSARQAAQQESAQQMAATA